MVYPPDEIEELLAAGEADAHEADRPEDIRPRFHRSKHGSAGGGGAGDATGADGAADGEDEDDNEDDAGAEVADWSLRKCSASGLDILAGTFGAVVLPYLLPELQVNSHRSLTGKSHISSPIPFPSSWSRGEDKHTQTSGR